MKLGALRMDEDIERRRQAIEFGRSSVRLEGFVLDQHGIEIQERFIRGEITAGEMIEAGLKHYSRANNG